MSTVTITLDDDTVRLAEEAARAANQSLNQWLEESICQAAAARPVHGAKSSQHRISPLHPGAMQPAADFNAPLEEFAPYVY